MTTPASSFDRARFRTQLAAHPLFYNVGDKTLDTLTAAAMPVYAPRGRQLFHQGHEAAVFYYVRAGWVKLFRETFDGQEAVVDVLTNGHIFAEQCAVNGMTYGTSAEALDDTSLVSFPLPLFRTQLAENHTLAMNLLHLMHQAGQAQQRDLEHRTVQSAAQRIGCFLLRLCKHDAKGAVTLHLPYDKTIIASRLGMQPETFSRALSRLKDDVGLTVKGASVTLPGIDALSGYCCSACSSMFPCEDLPE